MLTKLEQAQLDLDQKVEHLLNTFAIEKASDGWTEHAIAVSIMKRLNICYLSKREQTKLQSIIAAYGSN